MIEILFLNNKLVKSLIECIVELRQTCLPFPFTSSKLIRKIVKLCLPKLEHIYGTFCTVFVNERYDKKANLFHFLARCERRKTSIIPL